MTNEEVLTEDQLDRIRISLVEQYHNYLLDLIDISVKDEEVEDLVLGFEDDLNTMDDADLLFLDTNGMFSYKTLEKYKR
jgi:hypothetical protein